ncbi:charged multivesicular body protein 6-A-like [Argiope bruennichi]|uniref:Charged multivesicular body protein 6 like protein n=1 Tax=Argiope bruennichi TaxID=94029 RepID=A0A8T0FXT6_ARGBR|nr:charged multivesicular body protein 6-A-like [Argiope bruennichi]KAF8793643.1 Charged multivesicular body protein 6 like protein [Argiope bruennichi]
MGILFGKSKKKETRVTEQDKAVLQLKQQRDKLKQYQKRILNNLESERKLAKQLLQDGRKDKAKLLLRKKKFMEQMLTKTDGQLLNLEQMCHDIEFAQIEQQVIQGLKVGNESLKTLHEMLSIDDIERIMDETREGIEKQQEIDEILGGKLTDEDEEAVMNELESIIAESLPTPVTEPIAGEGDKVPIEDEELNLPEIPTEEPKQKVRRKEAPQLVAAS